MIDEIFVVKGRETRYFESRRALAKAAVEGYLEAKTQREHPLVVRFQRTPGHTPNSDLGPDIRRYLAELPNFVMSNVNERSSIVDAMEDHINKLLS